MGLVTHISYEINEGKNKRRKFSIPTFQSIINQAKFGKRYMSI